jgi:hypothetical protein
MFGTLVVQLPSDYSGGQLVVSHGGNDKVFDFSGIKGCTNFHYAAFYADCQHELKKVTKGYRLCLIYNLIYSGPGSLPAPIEDALVVSQLTRSMQLWNDEASQRKGPPMMAYILEHKYCEASLSFKGLKNIDRAVGDVLAKACQETNFDLYLAHVSRMEMWSASCYRKKYTLEELCDDSIDASHFISPQGQKPPHFSEMFLDDGAMVPKDNYKLGKPDEEERSEATGNEGASVERWYKWTALILWPQKRRLMNIGCDKMTNKLKIAVIGRSTPLTTPEKEESLKLARELVESDGHASTSAATLLQCLHNLGQTELIHEFLSSKISNLMTHAEFRKEAFNLCGSCVGWEVVRPSLLALISGNRYFTTCCNILAELVAVSLKDPSAAQPKSLCKELATACVKAVSSTGKYDASSADAGVSMLKVLLSLGDTALVSQFLLYLCSATYECYTGISIILRSQPFVEQLLAIGKAMGWETLKLGLIILFKKTTSANITEYCDLLCRLVCHGDLIPQQQLVCRCLMDIIVNIVITEQDFDPQEFSQPLRCGTSWDFRQDQERRAANSTRSREFVCSLLKVLVALEYDTVITGSVTDAFLRQPNRYPISSVVLPALEGLRSWLREVNSTTFISIVARFISVVQGWSKPGPSAGAPKNWSRNVTISCAMSCNDCKTLQEFLKDPAKNQIRFRMNQARRSHIEKQLNIMKCGTTHLTEKRGTPQVLVVNKVGQQVQERKRPATQQNESLRILARLLALCPPQLGGAAVAAVPQPKKQKMDTGVPLVATDAPRR